mmetsp:Transcript_1264/g.2011  ORF Transcript_1264/g.2011 Transcript_1264/m.2011 type:complete len:115 (+) Transcript_1264:210-554(+)
MSAFRRQSIDARAKKTDLPMIQGMKASDECLVSKTSDESKYLHQIRMIANAPSHLRHGILRWYLGGSSTLRGLRRNDSEREHGLPRNDAKRKRGPNGFRAVVLLSNHAALGVSA